MIIPLTYADLKKEMLAELSEIAVKIHNRPHKWRKYQPYSLEYTWIIDQVIKVLGDLQSKKIIDAGGGVGMVQYYFARRGAEIYNISRPIDMSNSSNNRILTPGPNLPNGQPGPSTYVIPNDMAAAKLEENHYDAATCISSIEHNPWPHIIRCATNLIKALKPGAPLVISVPAGRVRKWNKKNELPAMPMTIYLFDPEAVNELAQALEPHAKLITRIPDMASYQRLWDNTHKKLINTSGTLRYPFLSAGFVFVKK